MAEPPPFDFTEEGEGAGEEDENLFSDPVAPQSQPETRPEEEEESPETEREVRQ